MPVMRPLLAEAAALSEAREAFVFCTVVDAARSAPRDGGARMLVRRDGTIVGTIGGGPLEAAVIADALAMLAEAGARTRLFEASLTTSGEVHLGMKCGGEVRVLLDVHRPPARLHVFGAGHVGLKVAEAGAVAGWDVHVLDDRPDRLALVSVEVRRTRFAADRVEEVSGAVQAGDFVVIVTRCHDIDERVLKAAMLTNARYIGLIGSRRKAAVIFRNIRQAGLPDPSRDTRVFSPVGLALGSKEPGEIAISILAEVLAVRDGAPAPHRRLPARASDETVEDTPRDATDEDVAAEPSEGP